tara:strand:+ start:10666 stop:11169 length:504 start_codon:yes stop_codon:yes gene_type:complete
MKLLQQISFTAFAILLVTTSFGQKPKADKKAHKEKIQAMKIGYITEKLDLSSKEAEAFWPIYNEFDAKMDEARKFMRKTHKKEESIDDMTNAEVERMIEDINNMRQKELDILKEYNIKFKAILPIKKVAKLHKAEHGFKRELLKKLRVKKGSHNDLNIPPPPPGGRH